MAGRQATPEEVLGIVREDRPYYERSGGGITLSGGEPLMQAEFAADILGRCRDEGIHTAIDTCLECTTEALDRLLPPTDLIPRPRFRLRGRAGTRGDAWAERISARFTERVKEKPTPEGWALVPGLFSWASTIPMGKVTPATPNGRRAGAPISLGANPDNGFRKGGPVTPTSLSPQFRQLVHDRIVNRADER